DNLPETADGVRSLNGRLDAELLALFDEITPDELGVASGDVEWNLEENLGHIAEFPRYFARQLRQWFDGERVVIGRVAEHSADRNDAIVQARGRSLDEFRAEAETSFAELADVLGRLTDEHLRTP